MSASIDAFVRRVLADPADRTTRLVFADYLEEQGDAAWANYLRLRVELADVADAVDRDLVREALKRSEGELGAQLTVEGSAFVPQFAALLDLLPASRFTVTLGDEFSVPRDTLRRVTEPVAIEWRGLPLAQARIGETWTTLLGMVAPTDRGALGQLEHAVGSAVVAVRVPGDQLSKLVDRTFTRALALTRPATEVTAARVIHATPAEFETATESRQYLESLITEARANGWGGIELVAEVQEYQLYRLERGRPIRWHRLTREVGSELARVALLLSGERLGVRVSPRPTYFGPGVRVLILTQTPAMVPGN